jgi:hypothetical protein
MGYDPENYSQAQLDELDKLTEKWVADHLRKPQDIKKTEENSSLLRFIDEANFLVYRNPFWAFTDRTYQRVP